MIDLLGEGLRAATAGSTWAAPLVFAAGLATSIGPCVAPRYVAVAALAGHARRPYAAAAAFAAGVVVAYVAIGSALGAIATLTAISPFVDAAMAAAFVAAGVFVLARSPHACANERRGATSGPFLLGVTSSLVVSPCCTPVIGSIAGLVVLGGRTLEGAAFLACFALGHVAPVFAAAFGSRRMIALPALAARTDIAGAGAVVGGTLMLALGAFYGAIA